MIPKFPQWPSLKNRLTTMPHCWTSSIWFSHDRGNLLPQLPAGARVQTRANPASSALC